MYGHMLFIYIHTSKYIVLYIYIYINMYIYTYTYIYTCIYIHVYVYTHLGIFLLYVCYVLLYCLLYAEEAIGPHRIAIEFCADSGYVTSGSQRDQASATPYCGSGQAQSAQ